MLALHRLSTNAWIVLKLGCAKALDQGHERVQVHALLQELGGSGISEQHVLAALNELDHMGAISLDNFAGAPSVQGFTVTEPGLQTYCRRWFPGYEGAESLVKKAIWESGLRRNRDIDTEGAYPPLVIDHILRNYRNRGFFKLEETCCGVRPGLYIRDCFPRPQF